MITKRSIATAIILSLITCGIYSMYWMVKLTDEMNYLAKETNATNGVTALLLTIITCGIYGYYWAYKMGEKVEKVEGTSSSKAILYIILAILGLAIIVYLFVQDTLNKYA